MDDYEGLPGPCIECKFFFFFFKHDHGGEEVQHSWEEGYACIAFMREGSVIHLVGCDEYKPGCKMFVRREYEKIV